MKLRNAVCSEHLHISDNILHCCEHCRVAQSKYFPSMLIKNCNEDDLYLLLQINCVYVI